MTNHSLNRLLEYCEKEGFQGWDPYDGLNSKVFNALGLNKFPFFRLAWIQLFKRNPINLRRLFLVPKGFNPKGLGLFLSGYSKLLLAMDKVNSKEFDKIKNKIDSLANMLISLQSEGYSGACWGYNFDWQARGGLFFPSGTPTVVATTYAAFGLFDAYEATGEKRYLETAITSAKFVLNDLSRDYRDDGTFLFSYSVTKGNNTVYNASLLGSKLLSRVYHYTGDKNLIKVAKGSVQAVVNAQEEDGSWVYGELEIQSWKDSFHTGFNIECLSEYMKYSGDRSIDLAVQKGLKYYLKNFFTDNGVPKYYHNKTYPIDIHSPAQLVVTLASLGLIQDEVSLVQKVLNWTIGNMQSSEGYFYYQIKSRFTTKIPYMRWSQAWMAHSLIVFKVSTSG